MVYLGILISAEMWKRYTGTLTDKRSHHIASAYIRLRDYRYGNRFSRVHVQAFSYLALFPLLLYFFREARSLTNIQLSSPVSQVLQTKLYNASQGRSLIELPLRRIYKRRVIAIRH